jgi:hypothetical protein
MAALMMYGLRTWWVGAVGTTLLESAHRPTLTRHWAGGRHYDGNTLHLVDCSLKRGASPRSQLAGLASEPRGRSRALAESPGSSSLLIAGLLLMILAMRELVDPVGGFFGAGSLLLVAALLFWEGGCGAASIASSPEGRSPSRGSGFAMRRRGLAEVYSRSP